MNGSRVVAGGSVIVALCLGLGPRGAAADLPQTLDLSAVRALATQHDGRWPPLDTVARDCVESVTGSIFFDGQDPVLLLLAWTFAPQQWTSVPLITIGNAELRRELQLPADQTVFTYRELRSHRKLRELIDGLAHIPRGRKLDPLESKVSGIDEKLAVLGSAFGGNVIRPLPHASDPLGAWGSVAAIGERGDAAAAWSAMRTSFLADDADGFGTAAGRLQAALAALPAAHRPAPKLLATELRFNRLRPFRTAWMIMIVGAVCAAGALILRRRWLDVSAAFFMVAGFATLTYGLSLRWTVAGRIPAANMYESLLFLSWGMGAFAILSMAVMRDRAVLLTASGMGALTLLLADVMPLDHYIRPIPPVLMDTVWMSIHVPVIMVSYSVLALAMLIAHAQLVVMGFGGRRDALTESIDRMHYWYVHVGSILLLAGIVTGSMWAASSWGRYWGWDPKEVWSLIALLGYLTILHVRVDRQTLPRWVFVAGAGLAAAVFGVAAYRLAPLSPTMILSLVGAAAATLFFVLAPGPFATAVKSIVAFWGIIMTYLGVNYVLGTGLHSYGFGTGAVKRYMFLCGGIDLAIVALCAVVYLARRSGPRAVPAGKLVTG